MVGIDQYRQCTGNASGATGEAEARWHCTDNSTTTRDEPPRVEQLGHAQEAHQQQLLLLRAPGSRQGQQLVWKIGEHVDPQPIRAVIAHDAFRVTDAASAIRVLEEKRRESHLKQQQCVDCIAAIEDRPARGGMLLCPGSAQEANVERHSEQNVQQEPQHHAVPESAEH
eukprot:379354-Prymnesium_polylepis.2